MAELYWLDGLASQAGRWSYLGADVDPVEVRAFEREYADPVRRMQALGWRGPESDAGVVGQARFLAVRQEAERSLGHSVSWDKVARLPQARSTWGDRIPGVAFFLVTVLFVLGGISFVIEGVRLLLSWLTN